MTFYYDIVTMVDKMWVQNPRLMVIIVSFFISILLMILKSNYDRYIENKETMESLHIIICSFATILSSAIINNNKDLAREHYKILTNGILILSKKHILYKAFLKLQEYYIALQIGNYDDDSARKEKDLKLIDELKTKYFQP